MININSSRRVQLAIGVFLLSLLSQPASSEPLFSVIDSQSIELDLSGSGRSDTWRTFDGKGNLVELRYDDNGDGKLDEVVRREQNRMIRLRSRYLNGAFDWRETTFFANDGSVLRMTQEVYDGNWVTRMIRTYEQKQNRFRIEEIGEDGKRRVSYDSATAI